MIQRILLKFGASAGQPSLTFDPGAATVFVGPNSSGKSRVLREVAARVRQTNVPNSLLDVELRALAADEIDRLITTFAPNSSTEHVEYRILHNYATGHINALVHEHTVRGFLLAPVQGQNSTLLHEFMGSLVVQLDGAGRLSLADEKPSGDLQADPQNVPMAVLRDKALRDRVSSYTKPALDRYIVPDASGIQTVRFRMSRETPVEAFITQPLAEESRKYMATLPLITDMGDGVKAFAGIILAAVALPIPIIVVDEPEAFLHPPLARRVGMALAELAHERNGNLLAATHSADFLMGAIQSGKPVNVVRLTYDEPVATARILDATHLASMMRSPFMRSANVMSALFHRGAVVCEADADRAFYFEANARLQSAARGCTDTAFLNVNGKDQINRVTGPLRKMGVPAAIVVDLDIVESATLFDSYLRDSGVPDGIAGPLKLQRSMIDQAFKTLGEKPKRVGVERLAEDDRETAWKFIADLAEYGIFVVSVGELERWLLGLGVSGQKSSWLGKMFVALGDDPASDTYVRPTDGDVWEFLDGIERWVANGERKGMPS